MSVCPYASFTALAYVQTNLFAPLPKTVLLLNFYSYGCTIVQMKWWTILCAVKNRNHVCAADRCFFIFPPVCVVKCQDYSCRGDPSSTPHRESFKKQGTGMPCRHAWAVSMFSPKVCEGTAISGYFLYQEPQLILVFSFPLWKSSVVAICCVCLPHSLSPPTPLC